MLTDSVRLLCYSLVADETFIEFSYKSSERSTDKRTRSRNTQQKAAPVERNLDGSVKVIQLI